MDNPIICIPKVNKNINKCFINDIFNKVNLGKINRIDLINTNKSKRAFIHFQFWYDNERALEAKKWLTEGQDIKIIYSEPWYWKCSAFKANKYVTT